MNTFIKSVLRFLYAELPQYHEAIEAFRYFLSKKGGDREIPSSLEKELAEAISARMYRFSGIPESGTKMVVVYGDYNHIIPRDIPREESHILYLSPLQAVIGGFTITVTKVISFIEDDFWNEVELDVLVEDIYDWHDCVTTLPYFLEPYLRRAPKILLSFLQIEEEFGNFQFNQKVLNRLGKPYRHFKEVRLKCYTSK